MIVREKQSYFYFMIPGVFILLVNTLFNSERLVVIACILLFFPIVFSHYLYLVFFNEKYSKSAFLAGKIALDKGFDPAGTDGSYWNPENLTLKEVAEIYSPMKMDKPEFDSCGFMITELKYPRRIVSIDFYEYNKNENMLDFFDSSNTCVEEKLD